MKKTYLVHGYEIKEYELVSESADYVTYIYEGKNKRSAKWNPMLRKRFLGTRKQAEDWLQTQVEREKHRLTKQIAKMQNELSMLESISL